MNLPAYSPRFVSRLTKRTVALILAGGRGSRLQELTQWRAKPAVPFGGKYRIIDFPLSNCVNSGIRQIGVLTQYKAHSLIRHIQKGWGFLRGEFSEFVEILPAAQQFDSTWYLGTANAVYQNLDMLRSHSPDFVLVLAGDHIYKMDYGPMLAFHAAHEADLTIGCMEVPLADAKAFGVMAVDSDRRITSFAEKPPHPQPIPGNEGSALVSMGIYVFNRDFLIDQLIEDAASSISSHDFGHDIIPSVIGTANVVAYPFEDASRSAQAYWRDVGTIDSYWHANMDLISVTPDLDLYDDDWPIWTYLKQAPPAKFIFNQEERRGLAIDSMITDGSIVSGASISRSLLFSNVRVEARTTIDNSVILPDVIIGENCQIHNAVVDKGSIVETGTIIGEDLEKDALRFRVTEQGIVLITPDMLGQTLHHARGRW